MGSIYEYRTKAGETLFRIVYRDADNRQTSKRGFTGRRKAQAALNRVETQVADGDYIPAAKGRKPVSELATP